MAITFRVVPDSRSIGVRLAGPLSITEIQEFLVALETDPGYSPELDALLDAREIDVDFGTADLRGFASHHRARAEGRSSRWGIVVSEDLTYGMGRMFEAFMSGSPREFRVFRSMEEAADWVGVDPETLARITPRR
jgi:hypothetical protein